MPDLTPATFQPILAHLLHWGELSSAEARRLKAEAGLAQLTDGKLIQFAPDGWLIGPSLARLLPVTTLKEAWQKACWSLPVYRTYLTSLAAGEIARRGLEGAGELVEDWVAKKLPYRAPDFNTFLDVIEQNDLHAPLSESTPGTLVQAVQRQLQAFEKQSGLDFAAWNQALLGVSAPVEAVFQAALARGALAELPVEATYPRRELSPIQDLNHELAHSCGRWVFCSEISHPNPLQHSDLAHDPAWCNRRYVFSSVPLLNGPEDKVTPTLEQVQAAFCQHPLSWIIIQLALHAQIQATINGADPLCLTLKRGTEGTISDLRIELPGGAVRSLGEALSALVNGLGLHLVLPFGQIPPIALTSWVEALLQAHILEAQSDIVTLGEDFGRAIFESKYIQTQVKTPKPWRGRLVAILKGE